MKMNKKTLATVVMGALLTPIFGGVDASDLPNDNFTITGTVSVTTGDYDKANGTFTWNGANQGDIIKVGEPYKYKENQGMFTIKGLENLNFEENLLDGHSTDAALKAFQNAKVEIQNVKNINFGTKDKVLKADQGFHAYGSSIDVKADNIYGNVRGSGFLMSQSKGSANNIYQGVLKIKANQNIDLTSNYRGLIGVQSYDQTPGEAGTSTMEITAGGTVNLHVTGAESNQAVINMKVISWDGKPLTNGANLKLTIAGDKGVTITNDHGIGIANGMNVGQNDTNQVNLSITSKEGDVSIISAGNAIQSVVRNTADPTKVSQDTNSTIDVSGSNVNVVSKNGTAILLGQSASATLSANKDGGQIQISGKEAAASVGNGSTLVIGNGTNDTNVALQGQIQVVDSGTVTVADKTTTVVDASSLGANPLISATNGGKFEANKNAKLVIKGADTGTSLYAKDNAIAFWNVNNTSFDNPFQYLSDDGTVKAGITASNQNSLTGYLAPLVGIAATGANDKTLQPLLLGADSWNGAVGIGQAAGIQHSTYAVTGLFTDALTAHENTLEKDLWAKGFHSKEDIDGLGFGGGALSLDTQYNGTVVGMDVYQKNGTTAGVAIAYADGNISSSRGTVYTKNDATYLGGSLYGLKDLGSYRLAADLSYVGGSHDITQYNGNQVITAKPDTEAWTLGVKALKDYDRGNGTLTPYVGLRYLRLTTDSYTSSVGLSYDKENQDLCLLPVGVDYSLQVHSGSWTLKPYAGLSYIWTMGDRNANQTVIYGTATDGFAYDISDAGSFLGKLGLSASKGDYSFGVGYAYQNGSTTDSHTWTVQASYAF